ncbi:hypothetical protein SM007_37850 [Streptomyces avermitilis]|nr:hypothetical protein SM007_37850 [Streptomyces avermitilis]
MDQEVLRWVFSRPRPHRTGSTRTARRAHPILPQQPQPPYCLAYSSNLRSTRSVSFTSRLWARRPLSRK